MTNYDDLFQTWIREKEILDRCSPRTIDSYRDAWNAYKRYQGCTCEMTKARAKTFVLNAVNAKLTPRTINSYASGINSFLTWLHSNGYIEERIRVPLQPTSKRVLPTYTTEDAARVLNHRPSAKSERRLLGILHLIADAGLRIDECLTLPRSAVDYDNCLVTVTGKGSKVRIVPMSLTCRAVLFRWSQQSQEHPLLFCTASGSKLSVHNLRRDLLRLLRKCGVQKPAGSFHTWRRLSAKLFVRSGGDVATLSRILGHSKVSVTMDHSLEDDPEALRLAHRQHSPLWGGLAFADTSVS